MALGTYKRPAMGSVKQKWDAEFTTRAEKRAKRVKDEDANWLKVCKQVDTRDKLRSRISGQRANPKDMGLLVQGHRHHILRRSAGGPDTTENLMLVTGLEHTLIHAGKIRVTKLTKAGADGALEIYDSRTGRTRVSLPPNTVRKLKDAS